MAASEASQQANRSGIDPKRLVVIFFLVSALVLSQFFEQLLVSLWTQLKWPDSEVIEGLGWNLTTLLGVLLAAGLATGAYLHPRSRQLSVEVATELMKVTWPSWGEIRASTVAVVVASLVAASVLFGIDTLAYKMMVDWLPTLWGKL